MKISWKIHLFILTALTASLSALGAGSDFTLGIFGNANMDEKIDEMDIAYLEGVIKGTNTATNLSDANYDGRIDEKDIDQIESIIRGEEKELTILNCRSGFESGGSMPPEATTIDMPVERCVIIANSAVAETFRALNSEDKIVGVSDSIQSDKAFYPEISKLPNIGNTLAPDCEAILDLNPDLVLMDPWSDLNQTLPGVPVAYLGLRMVETYTDGVRKLAYILDRENEADEYANWFDGLTSEIVSQTEELSDSDKPLVLITGPGMGAGAGEYTTASHDNRFGVMCTLSGGKNIAEDLSGWWIRVDTEWVIAQNPDIIILWTGNGYDGYSTDDPSELAAIREDVMNRPELANVNAVKNGKVYVSAFGKSYFTHGPGCLLGSIYMAKWFHPDLFEDLDPQAIYQEYLTRFQELDMDLNKHGVFVYPP